jgi:fermentation-respiration switch protein FrsA (DUF1100 family)
MLSSGGAAVIGRVHRRAESLTERQPAVLITGSWLTVKEQMADHYARAIAARGYTAITFDFTGFGQSGGELRQVELPSRKIADIAAAARSAAAVITTEKDFVRLLPFRPFGMAIHAVPLTMEPDPLPEFRRWLADAVRAARDITVD